MNTLFLYLAISIALQVMALAEQGNTIPLGKLRQIAILDEGRIKPLDTYARNSLLQLSSKSTYAGKPAIHWLASVLFTPRQSLNDKVFKIENLDVVYAMGLEPEKGNRYSFAQLSPSISKLSELSTAALKTDEKKRTPVESGFIRLGNGMSLYLGIMNSFLFAFPHSDFKISDDSLANLLGHPTGIKSLSYLDIREKKTALEKLTAPFMSAEGSHQGDPSSWSSTTREAFQLASRFENWGKHYQNYPIHIIPIVENGKLIWISPWKLVTLENIDMQMSSTITALKNMVAAYQANESGPFNAAIAPLIEYKNIGASFDKTKITLELFYNQLDPFYYAKLFFGFSILLSLFSFFFLKKWFYFISALLTSLAVALGVAGLVLRVFISGRAPVTNLYETFVFVGFIGAALGLILEYYNRKGFGLLVGNITAFALLLLSLKYHTEGDNIGVLVAVLNSNFWLTTHVITISLGYAGFCMAAVVGHIYLIQRLFSRKEENQFQSLVIMIYSVLAFGLIFSFVGTVLGGIWADQSWGRFWGWDPKENGALMIVLWGAILFHALLAKIIGPIGLAAGSIFGGIVVMMAWFGINLLGVGLHSYGFTSGVANALAAYVILELVFIGVTLPVIHSRRQK